MTDLSRVSTGALRPDAPPYGVRGIYPVGTREFNIETADHAVDITVWYPALSLNGAKEEITYKISAKVGFAAGASQPVSGRAIPNATPDTAHAPYPLVIYSPGLAGWSQASSYLLEHFASYGFVVISSDPRGETFEEFWQGAATRPIDTRLMINYADKLTASSAEMLGLIDMDHVAVAGHSSGGWTALVGGGAQMDFGRCAANPEIVAANGMSNCTQFVPHADQIAAILGLASTPEKLWPPMNDPRVNAVVAFAPDGDIWGPQYEGVAALHVPTLVMTGSGDTLNIPERCAYPIYEHLGSAKKSLITFANADHMIFCNHYRDTPWMLPDNFWACADPVWDMDRAHDLICHFTTAFLLAELKGDAEATNALATENVAFPGITYATTAYAIVA
jgi:predicted dienelactone hydrolase